VSSYDDCDVMEEDVFDDYLWDREEVDERPGDAYCLLCEVDGHSFSACPRRDDE